MPVIDEYKFIINKLVAKLKTIKEHATILGTDKETSYSKTRFRVMTQSIDEDYQLFHDNMLKIVAYNSKQSPKVDESYDDLITAFDDDYYSIKTAMEVHIEPSQVNHSIVSDSRKIIGASTEIPIQLPKINLQEFDGDIKRWTNFADLFRATIHNNKQLSDTQKHFYLRSSLTGEAQSLVSSLALTGENYKIAWDVLQKRFDNTHLLTNSYLESLFNIPETTDDACSIRKMASNITEFIGALSALGHNTDEWAVPVLYLISRKVHASLRESWEKFVLANSSPSISQFVQFLNEQARVLEVVRPERVEPRTGPRTRCRENVKAMALGTTIKSGDQSCIFCGSRHDISSCKGFVQKSPLDRFNFAKENGICLRCLNKGHFLRDCNRKSSCKYCNGSHNSLLHLDERKYGNKTSGTASAGPEHAVNMSARLQDANRKKFRLNQTLLPTVLTKVRDRWGKFQTVRVLLDSASEANFISRDCWNRLKLKTEPTNVPVIGMAETTLGSANQVTRCEFEPVGNRRLSINALVVNKITTTPSTTAEKINVAWLRQQKLADPTYYRSNPIDILIGAEWFSYVVLGGSSSGKRGIPNIINTIWGICPIGKLERVANRIGNFALKVENNLDQLIRRFWEVEEPPNVPVQDPEEIACEEFYESTVERSEHGRYIVALPIKADAQELGESRAAAHRRFELLERKLSRVPKLRSLYNEFMKDYSSQGHMKERSELSTSVKGYYIPHHCIFKGQDEAISKFRVVFDASMKTQNGPSLNQILHVGPKLQADIVDLIIRFRCNKVVLVTDIRQMYRNIRIRKDDRDFQRILWRFNREEPIREFALTTVTYGVSASPYLAIRTLVADDGAAFPLASDAILNSMYMDDCCVSVPNMSVASRLKAELIQLLGNAGFELRKWMSNYSQLLSDLPTEHCAVTAETLSFASEYEPSAKILGLVWKPSSDHFTYDVTGCTKTVTKRSIMSDLAKLFDPIGFICPVIFTGKCLIRQLWQLGLDWDEEVPVELIDRWKTFKSELPEISKLAIERHMRVDTATSLELHGFADASEQGFAAVVYLRSTQAGGEVEISLLMAKSRVAPLKVRSIPRLELCGIDLVVHLLERAEAILRPYKSIDSINAWTDSRVALQWIRSSPHRWKTFVANRVSLIQDKISPDRVRFVPGNQNPADCASRGISPRELLIHPLWFKGPEWLAQASDNWPKEIEIVKQTVEEEKLNNRSHCFVTKSGSDEITSFHDQLFSRTNSFTKLKRIVAWIIRFGTSEKERCRFGLSVEELRKATLSCVKLALHYDYASDIRALQDDRQDQVSMKLRRVNAFLDHGGILRVGGRLQHSVLPFETNLIARVVGCPLLTYEECYTLLTQVEATLNSRPLSPLSSDPNDFQALTPGHFLMLEPPSALIEPDVSGVKSFKQRWDLLRKLSRSFRKQRHKWRCRPPNLRTGDLVLIKEENLPPLRWKLGRIVKTFPGKDGVVRVVEVRTASSTFSRPAVKLCPLPCTGQ